MNQLIHLFPSAGEDSDCEDQLSVHHGTVHKVSPGERLSLRCPFIFCNNTKLTVSWYKYNDTDHALVNSSHIYINLEPSSDLQGILYLTFKNIARKDSGKYQCRTALATSHLITVVVSGEWDLSAHTTMCNDLSAAEHEWTNSMLPAWFMKFWSLLSSDAESLCVVL